MKSFIISSIIILIGLIKFDIFIYPTLDYFGKYVFVGLLNLVSLWVCVMIYRKFGNIWAIIWGIVVLIFFWFILL
jgi:hypothetical protein